MKLILPLDAIYSSREKNIEAIILSAGGSRWRRGE